MPNRKKILNIVSISTLVASAIISAFTLNDAINSFRDKQKFDESQKTSKIIELLLTAGGHWAVERGVTNTSLHSSEIVSEDFANIFRERRKLGDKAYDEAMKQVEAITSKDLNNLIVKLNKEHKNAQKYRLIAEETYKKTKLHRDPIFLKNWVDNMSKQIIAAQDICYYLSQKTGYEDSEMRRQAYLKHFSWIMSEYAGRERAVIGAMLSSKEYLTPEKMETLYNYRGRVLAGWSLVQENANFSGNDVRNAIREMSKHFFGKFEAYRHKIYQESLAHKPYTTTASEWIKKSTNAIDTILSVQKESIKETNQYIKDYPKKFYNSLFLSTCIFIACMLRILWFILSKIDKVKSIEEKIIHSVEG